MCIIKLSEKEELRELRELKDVFPCWKVVKESGYCEYDTNETQPMLARRGTYEAEDHPRHRGSLDYPPSFHAYLEKPYCCKRFKIIKCWVRKEDVVRIGFNEASRSGILAVAVKRIMRK